VNLNCIPLSPYGLTESDIYIKELAYEVVTIYLIGLFRGYYDEKN
jgi:hypothetical protein